MNLQNSICVCLEGRCICFIFCVGGLGKGCEQVAYGLCVEAGGQTTFSSKFSFTMCFLDSHTGFNRLSDKFHLLGHLSSSEKLILDRISLCISVMEHTMQIRLVLNSQRFVCLCLPGIKRMYRPPYLATIYFFKYMSVCGGISQECRNLQMSTYFLVLQSVVTPHHHHPKHILGTILCMYSESLIDEPLLQLPEFNKTGAEDMIQFRVLVCLT